MAYASIADIFYQWESLGVFEFVLPFLLVFAVVFGILNTTKIMGSNKGVSITIALVIGLMSLRYRYFFSDFLGELFPRLGIGVSILLTLMILVGLFIAQEHTKYWFYGLGAIGVIIGIVIIYQSAESLGWYWIGNYGADSVGMVVLGILMLAIIIAIAVGKAKDDPSAVNFGALRDFIKGR